MNQLDFLDSFYKMNLPVSVPRFLVTGNDVLVRQTVLKEICYQGIKNHHSIIVIDDSENSMLDVSQIARLGYQIRDGLSDRCCLYNLFPIDLKKDILQIRKILGVLKYNEEQKMKVLSYLDFISYVEKIYNNTTDITLEILGEYSSNIQVGMKIQSLVQCGKIDEMQKTYLLSKYSEVCAAGADFEHSLLLLTPLISGQPLSCNRDEMIVYSISDFDGDTVIKNLIITLLLSYLKDKKSEQFIIIILDKGYGDRECLVDFIKGFPMNIQAHLFSEDVFTLSEKAERSMLYNRFPMRIYTRHSSELSCEAVERECGEIDVVKSTYTVNYDRRWRANRPIDILMGNNKVEAYTTGAPVREPRYRKEMIASFHPGTGIAEYMGNTILFSVK